MVGYKYSFMSYIHWHYTAAQVKPRKSNDIPQKTPDRITYTYPI